MRRADKFTIFMCQLSWNLGASTSWKAQGLFRPVKGLLYLYHQLYLRAWSGVQIWTLSGYTKIVATHQGTRDSDSVKGRMICSPQSSKHLWRPQFSIQWIQGVLYSRIKPIHGKVELSFSCNGEVNNAGSNCRQTRQVYRPIVFLLWCCGPNVGHGFLFTAGRTSDQPDAEISTWQHTTLTRDRHSCPGVIRTRNSCRREAADPRLKPRDHWNWLYILYTGNTFRPNTAIFMAVI
jgi:hypothetical protein